jgi:hypothetical protein
MSEDSVMIVQRVYFGCKIFQVDTFAVSHILTDSSRSS